MINSLMGIKTGMTSSYDARGRRVGATLIRITPNFVTQVKTVEGSDHYNAVQLGFGVRKSAKKSQSGQTSKVGIEQNPWYFKEIRDQDTDLKPGSKINLSQVFSVGDAVKVTGVSKGKGFAGGVKRHGFAGGPKTHGQSDRHRAPGSIGQTTTPGRVYKGKRMAGHMGSETVSVRGLEVVLIDKANDLLAVKGAVPGSIGSLVTVKKMGRIKGYTPPPEEKAEEVSESQESAAESASNQSDQEKKQDA